MLFCTPAKTAKKPIRTDELFLFRLKWTEKTQINADSRDSALT